MMSAIGEAEVRADSQGVGNDTPTAARMSRCWTSHDGHGVPPTPNDCSHRGSNRVSLKPRKLCCQLNDVTFNAGREIFGRTLCGVKDTGRQLGCLRHLPLDGIATILPSSEALVICDGLRVFKVKHLGPCRINSRQRVSVREALDVCTFEAEDTVT